MALLPNKANTQENNQTMDDRTPIPAGTYPAHITKSEFKATKAKTGHYLNLTWKVLDGPHKGKVVFNLLNLDNPNPVAVEIATKELNSICQAMGKAGVQDSDELHNIPVFLTLKVTEGTAQFAPKNEITGYKPASGNPSFSSEPVSAPPQQQEAVAVPPKEAAPASSEPESKKLPWE